MAREAQQAPSVEEAVQVAAMTTIATECNVCPKGVVACAHLDGKVVWLVDYGLLMLHDTQWRPGERWGIRGPSPLQQCVCEVDHIVLTETTVVTRTDSLPDAEVEFERRCALLRAEA